MFLMAALTALLVILGYTFGGTNGAVLMFAIALGMNFFSYWFSDKAVIASTGARPLDREEAPDFYEMADRLAANAGIPTPALYTIDDPAPNAFATGRDPAHGVVVVSSGLLSLLNRDEVAGVVDHEMAHIQNRDILTQTIAASMAGAITSLARIVRYGGMRGRGRDGNPLASLVMIVLAPLAALLIQMAVSRSREFAADEEGSRFSGNPLALASALERIQENARALPQGANPSMAHMFIISPLTGGIGSLFSTHPPTEERVARLRALASAT
jgi:heat shock protein HtpX